MINKKIISFVIVIILILLSFNFISSHGEEEFHAAEEIIEQKIPCSELNEEQLEIIGDYYMEQMHPGEAHIKMDEMMGGEGSESLRQMHINMGIRFYCNGNTNNNYDMMDMIMGRNTQERDINGVYGYGFSWIFNWIFIIIVIIALVLLIVWLIKQVQKK